MRVTVTPARAFLVQHIAPVETDGSSRGHPQPQEGEYGMQAVGVEMLLG